MKLETVWVQNYRSFTARTELVLNSGMNALVGPNNCGKSNFLRAIAMALDPGYLFDRARDMPAQRKFAYPRTTLTFRCDKSIAGEKTLLRYAEDYERSIVPPKRATYAQDGLIRLVVAYPGNAQDGATRQEYFAARGVGDRRGSPDLNAKLLKQFRKHIRFVAVDSGQSLESLLTGKFREILHAVLKSSLSQDFTDAERARDEYVEGLRAKLLAPLRDKVEEVASRLFPEVCDVELTPFVSHVDQTLSDVSIAVRDSVATSLRDKGTGVASGVLIATMRYLADTAKHSIIFAIEEPEAFLHPAAQEKLRDDLEGVAERDNVTLLVTTHSPFILSRDKKAQVTVVSKSDDGSTTFTETVSGDTSHAGAISGLFRDSAIPEMLDRYAAIPTDTEAILLVEGTTDLDFLALAAEKLALTQSWSRVFVMPAAGTDNLVVQAVLLRAESAQPVWALVDSDENGRKARDNLTKRFGFARTDVLTYGQFFGGADGAESEWLFPGRLLQQFVEEAGEDAVLKSKSKLYGDFRYDFTPAGKDQLPDWLRKNASVADLSAWRNVLETVCAKL